MLTITSIFNPVNWIKFTKDPKKGFEVLKKIICDYPRIQKLLKIKNKFLRKQIINFYNFFVSHNKSLKFFFIVFFFDYTAKIKLFMQEKNLKKLKA